MIFYVSNYNGIYCLFEQTSFIKGRKVIKLWDQLWKTPLKAVRIPVDENDM